MSETTPDVVDPLARGFVLALALLGAEESVLPAVDEPRREALADAWRTLRALDEAARARVIETWRAEVASGLPRGLSGLHSTWLDEVLAGERPEVVAILRAAPGASPGTAVEIAGALARLAFGRLAPLCEGRGGALADHLCNLGLDALLSELRRRGARTVGHSLSGATPSLRAKAMAAVGEPWAREIAAGCAEEVGPEQRVATTALASTMGLSGTLTAVERLTIIGLAALKAELRAESPGSCVRVAGRLPAPLGRVLAGW